MKSINYFDKEITIDEFVKIEICKNDGTHSLVFKEQLENLCKEKNIPIKNKMSKNDLFDLLIKNGMSCDEFAITFGIGVGSLEYQKAFGITKEDVKRLEKHGVLKVIGKSEFYAYGRYLKAPIYDIFQYREMTAEQMQKLLEEYPKGKRIKKTV